MSDFEEAVAADEAERGEWDEEDDYLEAQEEGMEDLVNDQPSAADYLDILSDTIESLDQDEPEA